LQKFAIAHKLEWACPCNMVWEDGEICNPYAKKGNDKGKRLNILMVSSEALKLRQFVIATW